MDKLRKHIEEIIPITDEEFTYIQTFFTLKKLRKHQYLIQEGDQVNFEYLILAGVFRVFYLDDEGKEHILQFAGENWWMSDYQAFFNQKQAGLHITCMEDGEVLCLTLESREKLAA